MTFLLLFTFLINTTSDIKVPTAETILKNSIKFHDPTSSWKNIQIHFEFNEIRPQKNMRTSSIDIDNLRGNFCIKRKIDDTQEQHHIKNNSCFHTNNSTYESSTNKERSAHTNKSLRLRNYYTYLWGLPMKLNDKGTHIDKVAILTQFDNKIAYQIKVYYDKEVGSDTWFFYFSPSNYAMIGYKFYHNQDNNDGEFIILSESIAVCDLKIPKSRSWYTNNDSTYLGVDMLASFGGLEHIH